MNDRIDWQMIARLIADGVRVVSGDRVSVFVTDRDAMDAVSAFVEECWRRGAVPQVVATDERFDASSLRWADVSVLREPLPLEAYAMEWSDVHVSFRAMTRPFAEASAERIAALRRGRGVVSTMRWEGTRWALVRVPTPEWANAFGLDEAQLRAEWAASFDTDWSEAAGRMGKLCRRLGDTEMATISDNWGTLTLPIAARTWVPFSGSANWPDGEVATAPIEDAVEGEIAFPGRFVFAGVAISDLRLTLQNGIVVKEEATEGLDFVRRVLDTDAGARRVGELGIGTNAALRTMTGDLLIDEKILGTVHIALGRAYPECGGVNRSALHWDIVKDLRARDGGDAGSLRCDDTWLIRDGLIQPALAEAIITPR